MNEVKRNRLIAAVTVNVVILIAVLAAVIIYQLVNVFVLTSRRNQLRAEVVSVREQTQNAQDTLDYYKSKDYLLDKAFEFGFVFGDEQ